MKYLLIIGLLAFASTSLTACNTITGMAEDITSVIP